MKMPDIIKVTKVTTEFKNGQMYAHIKIKRWGWGWLAFTKTKPTRVWDIPIWIAMCLWVAAKGLAGKIA